MFGKVVWEGGVGRWCAPFSSNWMSKCFPKREELSLRTVLALPMASMTGFVCMRRAATGSASLISPFLAAPPPLVAEISPM